MSYTKNPTWQDGKAGGTLITAATLNHLEDGVAAAAATADSAQAGLAGKANTAHTHAAADVTDFAETVRDTMGTALVAGSNVTITVDDPGDTITIAASGGGGSAKFPTLAVAYQAGGSGQTWLEGRPQIPHSTGWQNVSDTGCIDATPVRIPAQVTIDRIAVNVTDGALAGRTVRVGIAANRANSDGPAVVLLDSGSIDASTTGIKEVTLASPVTLAAGDYWFIHATNTNGVKCQGWKPTVSPLPASTAGGTAGWYLTSWVSGEPWLADLSGRTFTQGSTTNYGCPTFYLRQSGAPA